jgi:maleylacetoacetate isomerase
MLQLHTYALSSASYRVRIALALKGLEWDSHGVSLIANEHLSLQYLSVNPQGRVPALTTEQGTLTQSFAIIDWLEESFPSTPSVYPIDLWKRALCRAFAHVIATDIFPLQNLSTRRKLNGEFGADDARQAAWSRDWITTGFEALEAQTLERAWKPEDGFLFGETPTLADICLVPQMNNARRYNVDLSAFPLLVAADARARTHHAFSSTSPETQMA